MVHQTPASLTGNEAHIVNDFDNLRKDEKLVLVLDKGCQHLSILKSIMKMWIAWF